MNERIPLQIDLTFELEFDKTFDKIQLECKIKKTYEVNWKFQDFQVAKLSLTRP